ncbi:MAG: DsrE family protein [Thermoleophilia bacterium]
MLWYVRSDGLGQDEKIGGRLIQSFFNSIGERVQEPADFFFMNRGIFLTLDDSPVLDALRGLESKGCRLLSCGTCLDYFQATERLSVGSVGSMAILQGLMVEADQVVTL